MGRKEIIWHKCAEESDPPCDGFYLVILEEDKGYRGLQHHFAIRKYQYAHWYADKGRVHAIYWAFMPDMPEELTTTK